MPVRFWHNPDEPVGANGLKKTSRPALHEWRLLTTSVSTAFIPSSSRWLLSQMCSLWVENFCPFRLTHGPKSKPGLGSQSKPWALPDPNATRDVLHPAGMTARMALSGRLQEGNSDADDRRTQRTAQDRHAHLTNVVATYPKNPLCLGLYNPWTEKTGIPDHLDPLHLPRKWARIVGHAVTCVYGLPDPNYTGRLSFMDVVDALDAMQHPTILVIQQKWPAELMAKAGLAGEIMVTSMKAVGCIGMLSNGPSRDVDAVRRLNFQMLLAGVTAGHGDMAVQRP